MKKIIKLTNNYIVIATPLILYTLISGIYTAMTARSGNLINTLIAVFILMLITSAFIAGWFNMVKLASTDAEPNDPNSIIKNFIPGVGEYFLTTIGSIFVIFILNVITLAVSVAIGMHTIGDPGISADSLSKALSNTEALKAFLTGLTSTQLLKLNLWNMLLLGMMTLTYFLLILYIPAIFFKSKNPFKAFFISLKDLFSRHFIKTTGIYLLIFVINFFISILSAIFAGNIVTNFIMTLVNFYFICTASVGVFYYYNEKFVQPQIGQNIDMKI